MNQPNTLHYKPLQVLAAGLAHPHSRVRLALLSALDALMASGAAGQPLVEGLVVPGARPLAADRAPAVREALFSALAVWMGAGAAATTTAVPADADAGSGGTVSGGGPQEAPTARCRRLAPLLLPLLLLGVSDESQQVAALALAKLEAVGGVWAAGEPTAASAGQGGEAAAMQIDGQEDGTAGDGAEGAATSGVSDAAVAAAALPPPYQGRPCAGACAMGGALLPQLLPPLLRELGEWTVAMRCSAARCLHALLVLAGPAATPQLGRLLPALCAAVGDEEAEVAARVAACARFVGALVPAAHWLPLAADAVADGKTGNSARANTLVVLATMLHAAGCATQRVEPAQLAALAAAVGGDDVLAAAAEHAGARLQLLAAVCALLAWAGAAAGAPAMAALLYRALMQLHGSAEAEGPAGAGEVAAVRETLLQLEHAVESNAAAAAAGDAAAAAVGGTASSGNSGLLCAAYGAPLLEALAATADTWSAGSPPLLAFSALLRTAPPAHLAALLPRAVEVVSPIVSDHESDPALRLALLRLVDGLLESESSGEAFWVPGATAAVLTRLVMPPLTWRAGKVAAAVRFQAVGCLATAVRRRLAGEEALAAAVDAGLLPLLHQVRGLSVCGGGIPRPKTSIARSELRTLHHHHPRSSAWTRTGTQTCAWRLLWWRGRCWTRWAPC
jgi:hypothetical protein